MLQSVHEGWRLKSGERWRACGSADPQRRSVGSVLCQKWHLDAWLGAGAMSSVFAATHRLGWRAAIKILRADADEHARTRFLREGRLGNDVRHRGVARVIDDDIAESGEVFLVMDLFEGEPLSKRLARVGRLHAREVIALGIELLDVLGAVHAAGIVHCDIKPDNVLLTNEGGVCLLDFGIARLAGDVADEDRILGTAAFMPPEQAVPSVRSIDARSDLFAVAGTLWASLSGRAPRVGETSLDVLVRACIEPVSPMRAIAPDVDPALAAVIDRGLQLDRARRWPDVATMAAALRGLV